MISSDFGFSVFFSHCFSIVYFSRMIQISNYQILKRRSIKHNLYRKILTLASLTQTPNRSPSTARPVMNFSLLNSRKNFNFHFGFSTTTQFSCLDSQFAIELSGLSLRDKFVARYSKLIWFLCTSFFPHIPVLGGYVCSNAIIYITIHTSSLNSKS